MSTSLYRYSVLANADPPESVVISFAICVIFSGITNLVLVCSQMMCLCVCHEKYLNKSIRLQNCCCRCKDKVDFNIATLRRASKRHSSRKETPASTADERSIQIQNSDIEFQSDQRMLNRSEGELKH